MTGDRLYVLFTPNHSLTRKTNASGKTLDLHKVAHQPNADWNQVVDELFGHDLSSDFEKITLAFWMDQQTLVPEEVFDSKKKEHYFGLEYKQKQGDQLFHSPLGFLPYSIVHPAPEPLVDILAQRFPDIPLQSGFKMACQEWMIVDANRDRIFVHFFEDEMVVCYFEESELIEANRHSFAKAEDVLYFILSFGQVQNVDVQRVAIYLSGLIDEDSEQLELLKNYFSEVSVLPLPAVNDSFNLLKKNPQHYFHLFTLR